jgi:hypothetical protein
MLILEREANMTQLQRGRRMNNIVRVDIISIVFGFANFGLEANFREAQ